MIPFNFAVLCNYFYNNEEVNTFAFVFKNFTSIEIDQQDLDIVEVCNIRQVCKFDGHPACKHSRAYSQLAVLKVDGEYVFEESNATAQYIISKGYLKKPALLQLPFYEKNNAVGSDKLLLELYE